METLISYKNSYSDFKQSYQVQLEHAKGQLKYGIRYGENYRLPLDEKKVVFYLSNNDQRMECLLKVMEAFVKFNLDQEYTIKVIFGAKLDKNLIPKAFQKYIEHPSDAEAQEDLATAKYLLSGESLPKYFVRKEGQNVIRFFDEFHKEENNRLELAQNKLSWLINSTFVFTEDAKSAEYLSDNPYFMELQGKVEQFSENIIRSKEEIIDHILNRKIEDVKSDKEHILIFVSAWKDEELEERYLRLITDNMNYDQKDVILVMKRPEDGYKEDIVQHLNEHVRIIYRQGTFPCSAAEYIDVQYLLKNFDSFEDVEKAYGHLNTQVIQRETKRLFGDRLFHDVIYIGAHSALWTILAGCVEAKNRLRIQYTDLVIDDQEAITESKKRAFSNRMELYQLAFDKIVFPNLRYKEQAIEREYVKAEKACYFEFPTKINLENDKKYENISYLGNLYFIGSRFEYEYGGVRLDLFPIPEEGKLKYITNAEICDESELLEMFTKMQEKDSQLVLYGETAAKIRETAKQFGVEDQMLLIEKERLDFSDQMEKYLDSFDGYLYVGNESSYCPIRAGMELLGKDIFVMEDGIIKKDEKKQFKDERSFEEFRMKKWDDFL